MALLPVVLVSVLLTLLLVGALRAKPDDRQPAAVAGCSLGVYDSDTAGGPTGHPHEELLSQAPQRRSFRTPQAEAVTGTEPTGSSRCPDNSTAARQLMHLRDVARRVQINNTVIFTVASKGEWHWHC